MLIDQIIEFQLTGPGPFGGSYISSRKTLGRKYIIPNVHFPERTLSKMFIWPNGHFPESLFSRIDTGQNVQLMLAIIIQEDEIKLFCSVSRVNICFISGLVLLLVL